MLRQFIFMTSIAYLIAILLPTQLNRKGSSWDKLFYFIMFLVYLASLYLNEPYLFLVLGIIYAGIGTWCYSGGQDWGSVNHNLFMTLWDLSLSVAFLMLSGFPFFNS